MKKIIIITILVLLGVSFLILKNYIFKCKWCTNDNKTFLIETKSILQSAYEKNKIEGINIFCKDSINDYGFNLSDRKDIYYYLEFNDTKLIKMVVYDKNHIIRKEDNNGILVKEISNKDYDKNYNISFVKCN